MLHQSLGGGLERGLEKTIMDFNQEALSMEERVGLQFMQYTAILFKFDSYFMPQDL